MPLIRNRSSLKGLAERQQSPSLQPTSDFRSVSELPTWKTNKSIKSKLIKTKLHSQLAATCTLSPCQRWKAPARQRSGMNRTRAAVKVSPLTSSHSSCVVLLFRVQSPAGPARRREVQGPVLFGLTESEPLTEKLHNSLRVSLSEPGSE